MDVVRMRDGRSGVAGWFRNFGPAWIVMIADIDIASIITALQAGSTWGYRMVFVMLILTMPLFLIQDAAGRLGAASGVGLGEAIGKFFGRRAAVAAAFPMGLSDFLEYVAEYAGMAIGLYLLGLPVLPGLLFVYVLHTAIVVGRRYRHAELVLIPLSFLVVVAIAASTFLFHMDVGDFLSTGLSPFQPYGSPSFDYLLAASIGAVVMPWMLYFHSGANSRRNKQQKDLKNERVETLVGAIVSEVLMAVIVVDGLNLSTGGALISQSELSGALPLFGPYASTLMGVGFLFAGFLALVVISLGSAWGVLEAIGRSSRRSFLTLYAFESIPAVVLVAVVTGYIQLMLNLMVVYTIVIVPSLYFLGRMVSDARVMNGNHYSRYQMAAFWLASASIVVGGILGLITLL